jgi:hypothetical protein
MKGMLRGEFESADEANPESLRRAYDEVLAESLQRVEVETATAETDIEESTLQSLIDRESPEIELSDAAAILALAPERPDAEAIEAEARDILLMGMTTAVLDVEAIASGIDDALEPKEIQQKIEGRFPMTLDEYAMLHAFIESRKR